MKLWAWKTKAKVQRQSHKDSNCGVLEKFFITRDGGLEVWLGIEIFQHDLSLFKESNCILQTHLLILILFFDIGNCYALGIISIYLPVVAWLQST